MKFRSHIALAFILILGSTTAAIAEMSKRSVEAPRFFAATVNYCSPPAGYLVGEVTLLNVTKKPVQVEIALHLQYLLPKHSHQDSYSGVVTVLPGEPMVIEVANSTAGYGCNGTGTAFGHIQSHTRGAIVASGNILTMEYLQVPKLGTARGGRSIHFEIPEAPQSAVQKTAPGEGEGADAEEKRD